jgi:hypothetical protein
MDQSPPSVTQPETQSAAARSDKKKGAPHLDDNPEALPPGGSGTHANIANPMAQMQGGVVQATVTTSTQYSGFEEPMKKWGLGMETSIP